RDNAFHSFLSQGFPHKKHEKWRNTDLSEYLQKEYSYIPNSDPVSESDINSIFRCEIHNFETYLFTLHNGAYVYKQSPLTTLDNGVVVGSLRTAWEDHDELVKPYLNSLTENMLNGLVSLNSALATAGLFIYVPDNVIVEKPVQLINMINTAENPFLQAKNLIVLGKNAELTFVQCDDSVQDQDSFMNVVSEFHIDEGAKLDHYKLQNKELSSVLVNTSFFSLRKDSKMKTNTITLNGGKIRNETIVNLDGEGAEADIMGLYLVDKQQHVDNQVLVRHNSANCYSNELFKGILDDEATAAFNGHILVQPGAQKTNAYQNNKNILLTDNAKVTAKPFLEIYADDVKCSHGATVGQLDEDALFYLKQRGICDLNAKMLLMYAFAEEVIRNIDIPSLHDSTADMVNRRLKGELSACNQCVLHCNDQKPIEFDIDLSKL
ncbi:MAG: Fe-S cluster assembly protein SufD, partial [Marinilabiliales bacterium]